MVADTIDASFEAIEQMERRLVQGTRSAGVSRLALGAGFEALAERGGHHEMGFSSLEAYALERCERSARWVQQARALARKLNALPAILRALRRGGVTWSMASVIANEAMASDEEWWLAEAEGRTVRQIRQLVRERRERLGRREPDARGPDARGIEETADERCTLTVTVDQEDAWLFESARMVVERIARTLDGERRLRANGRRVYELMANVPAEVSSDRRQLLLPARVASRRRNPCMPV